MKKIVFVVMLSLVGAVLATPVSAQPVAPGSESVSEWNQLALNAVRLKRASDADAAPPVRDSQRCHVRRGERHPRPEARRADARPGAESGPDEADPQAAAVSAAHAVLVALDPDRTTLYDDTARRRSRRDPLRAPSRRRGRLGPARRSARRGRPRGRRLHAGARRSRPAPVRASSRSPGPACQYRNVRPFAVADATRYVLGPPPALDSLDYAAAFAEVALLGNAAIPAPDKLATFQYWSLPAGSDQPPGEWVKIALIVAAARDLSLDDAARLLALLTMAGRTPPSRRSAPSSRTSTGAPPRRSPRPISTGTRSPWPIRAGARGPAARGRRPSGCRDTVRTAARRPPCSAASSAPTPSRSTW